MMGVLVGFNRWFDRSTGAVDHALHSSPLLSIYSVASWTAESLLDFLQESIPPPSRTEKEEEGDKQGAAHEEL